MQPVAKECTSEQGTDQWIIDRLGYVTASEFATVMSKGKNGAESVGRINYRAKLVSERLTNAKAETWKSADMIWGNETEPLARLRYTLATGNDVTECGFFAHNILKAGASPDGLVGEVGTIEIKCPNTATHIETLRKQTTPTQYYWQMQGQLWMTGRQWCDFVSFDPRLPNNAALFIKRVERNEEDIRKLEATVIEFLKTVDDEVQFIQNYKEN